MTTPLGTSPKSPADVFTYIASALPAVTGISPNSGPVAGGTSVTITGSNFTGATGIHFGTLNAPGYTINQRHVDHRQQPGELSPGPVDVTVTTPSGTSPTSPADVFTYLAAPTVTGLNPPSGPAAGGTTVTISGTSFLGATAVTFGTTAAASFSVINYSTIMAVSPPGSAPSM